MCFGLYECLRDLARERISTSGASLESGVPQSHSIRPHRLPRAADFMADFACAGQAVLSPSRLVLFRLYYLGGCEYPSARGQIGLSEIGWSNWTEEVRRKVGKELLRRGVFPPKRYFREPSTSVKI